jgi:hypothetical protein
MSNFSLVILSRRLSLVVAQPVMQGRIPVQARDYAHPGLHTREGERDSGRASIDDLHQPVPEPPAA